MRYRCVLILHQPFNQLLVRNELHYIIQIIYTITNYFNGVFREIFRCFSFDLFTYAWDPDSTSTGRPNVCQTVNVCSGSKRSWKQFRWMRNCVYKCQHHFLSFLSWILNTSANYSVGWMSRYFNLYTNWT